MLGRKQVVACRSSTLSNIITSQHLDHVDLLKIDVERAELDVLKSIATEHWALIRQIVLEVHDLEGRLAQIMALLQQKGFEHIVCQQSKELEGSVLFTLYCRREL